MRTFRVRMLVLLVVVLLCAMIAVGMLGAELIASSEGVDRTRATRILAGTSLAILAAWSAAVFAVTRMVSSVRSIAAATRAIAQGQYPSVALAGISTDGEIGELQESISTMGERLREVDARDRRFLMSVSHELRTPLTAIAGHAQALDEGLAEDPETRHRSLAVIQREASRLERLVEDIIDLARLRSNRFSTVAEEVHTEVLGDHLMAVFGDRSQRPEVAIVGSFEPVAFQSDGERILQILRNLVNNSLRYANERIEVEGRRERGHILFRVTNDGDPIEPERLESIFEPFVGTKREGGMGLGLAIGRELAWALGGNLRGLPNPNGATFELMLPLEPPGSGR